MAYKWRWLGFEIRSLTTKPWLFTTTVVLCRSSSSKKSSLISSTCHLHTSTPELELSTPGWILLPLAGTSEHPEAQFD